MAQERVVRIVQALLLLAAVADICEGITCYTCEYLANDQENPCYDPSKTGNKAPTQICSKEGTFCVKKKEFDHNQPYFARGCTVPPKDVKEGCGPAGNPKYCICSKDLCNTWPGSQLSLTGSSMPTFVDPKAVFLPPALLFASSYYIINL